MRQGLFWFRHGLIGGGLSFWGQEGDVCTVGDEVAELLPLLGCDCCDQDLLDLGKALLRDHARHQLVSGAHFGEVAPAVADIAGLLGDGGHAGGKHYLKGGIDGLGMGLGI